MSSLARRAHGALSQARASVTVFVIACAVEVGLRTMPLPALARRIGAPLAVQDPGQEPPTAPGQPPVKLTPRQRRQVRTALRMLNRWPFGDTCLRQALVCGRLLRDLSPALHVGVAKAEGEVRAHAWLIMGNSILDPIGSAASYLTLETVPAPLA